MCGVHGQGQLSTKAVPPLDDANLGRRSAGQPQPAHRRRPRLLEADADNPGSLGLAIAEAVEEAASRKDTTYGLGSVLNHVLLHQTVIGLEAIKQFALAEDYPDMVFAPCGGGSNFGGVAFPSWPTRPAASRCGWWRWSRPAADADPWPLCV